MRKRVRWAILAMLHKSCAGDCEGGSRAGPFLFPQGRCTVVYLRLRPDGEETGSICGVLEAKLIQSRNRQPDAAPNCQVWPVAGMKLHVPAYRKS